MTYTRRLGHVVVPSAVWTSLYVTPAGYTAIIRDVLVVNDAVARPAGQSWLAYIPAGGGARLSFIHWPTLPIGTQHYDLRQELVAGDTLQAYTSTGPITFAVTGYVFGV